MFDIEKNNILDYENRYVKYKNSNNDELFIKVNKKSTELSVKIRPNNKSLQINRLILNDPIHCNDGLNFEITYDTEDITQDEVKELLTDATLIIERWCGEQGIVSILSNIQSVNDLTVKILSSLSTSLNDTQESVETQLDSFMANHFLQYPELAFLVE